MASVNGYHWFLLLLGCLAVEWWWCSQAGLFFLRTSAGSPRCTSLCALLAAHLREPQSAPGGQMARRRLSCRSFSRCLSCQVLFVICHLCTSVDYRSTAKRKSLSAKDMDQPLLSTDQNFLLIAHQPFQTESIKIAN